jgi:hypothetical protein
MATSELMRAADTDWERVQLFARPGACSRPVLLEWLARIAERALARVESPDPRSVAVIAALRSDTVTPEMRHAADYAAYRAADGAVCAAYCAYCAYDSQYCADASHMGCSSAAFADAELAQQVADAYELGHTVEEEGT